MDRIWWTKVTNASRFLDKIVDTVQDQTSIFLQLPDEIPWYETMCDVLQDRIKAYESIRRIERIVDTGEEPGLYLLNKYCKEEKRAQYRPHIGYAEFLAGSDDIVLNDYILWITDVNEAQFEKWSSFIETYNKVLGKKKEGCIFIIEIRREVNIKERKRIKKISYVEELKPYDYYLFNALIVSDLDESSLFKQYMAETVLAIFPNDVELSSMCVSCGRQFLENPEQVIRDIEKLEFRSDGSPVVVNISGSSLQERIWRAQIKVVFPLVERHRNILVKKYQQEIETLLPLNTTYGERFEDVNDVELGTISYLTGIGKIKMSQEDKNKLFKLKSARNILAHIGILQQNEVDEIFEFEKVER